MWKSVFLTMSLISSASWAAGNDAGGGAGAVVCRDSATGTIKSAEILDLYEARLDGIRLRAPLAGEDEEYIGFLDARDLIRTSRRPTRSGDEITVKLGDFHKTVRDFYSFTGENEHVRPTGDFGRLPKVPAGCRIEQLARFDYHRQKILIDTEIWASLDNQNRIALYVHEFYYRQYRMAGERDSSNARKLLGLVFAEKPLAFGRDGVPAGALVCYGEGFGLALFTEFYLFENPLRPGETVLQFASVVGRETLWPTRLYLPIMIDPATVRNNGNDGVRIMDRDLNYVGGTSLEGGMFNGVSLYHSFKYDEPVQLRLNFVNRVQSTVTIQRCSPLAN